MTAKILDPVVISAYIPNRTAKREPFILEPCSLEIHNCELNFKKITLHTIRALAFRDAVYGTRDFHHE
jgi:hypothetical protein